MNVSGYDSVSKISIFFIIRETGKYVFWKDEVRRATKIPTALGVDVTRKQKFQQYEKR